MHFRGPSILFLALAAWLVASSPARSQVVLVEPGHTLKKIVDSEAPLDPSQSQLGQPDTRIESIGVNPNTGTLYIQLSRFAVPLGGGGSLTSDIYCVTPAGVVSPVALNTGFGINERGVDLHYDKSTGLLVTQDSFEPNNDRIATVDPTDGTLGTYATMTSPVFGGGTFGMDFSAGVGGSVVPGGEIVFTADVSATGIWSAGLGDGSQTAHVPIDAFPGGGDDMVIQPDGDWVWIGDFELPITAIQPFPPYTQSVSPLAIATVFDDAGLPYAFGSRGTVCKSTGDIFVSFSGGNGGTGIFRISEDLTTATLVLTIGAPLGGGGGLESGLHDLVIGPSTEGFGQSVFFTVQNNITGGQQVWECTVPECPPVECYLVVGAARGTGEFSAGGHTWATQVDRIRLSPPVTIEQNPGFTFGKGSARPSWWGATPQATSGPAPLARFSVQVLMWNPEVFPENPEQFSNGLEVRIWPDGSATGRPYGNQDGIEVSVETYVGADGKHYVRFPFTIDGMND